MGTVRCLMCGMSILSDAKSYERHIEQKHSMDGYRVKIKPVNTSGRTKAQIVNDMEKGVLAPFVMELDPKPTTVAQTVIAPPAMFCGPTGKVCVWEDNGWEICGPCARLKASLEGVPA